MELPSDIAQTASLVNDSRHRRVDISHDRYAKLWVNDATRERWEAFAREVYPHDDIELSLRNRFFLDRLIEYLGSGEVSAFVNIGAGFTSYPFLIEQPGECIFIEVDKPSVTEHKKERIARFQEQRVLPTRPAVVYLAGDVEQQADVSALESAITAHLEGRASFVLLEGVSYYLQRPALDRLLPFLRAIQVPGSVFSLDFWTPANLESPVTRRFRSFVARNGWHPEHRYSPLTVAEVVGFPGYEVIEITNVQELERVYTESRHLADPEMVLPENYAVLRRITELHGE